ncbi:MAG: hypothetical protein Q9226_006239 [Calogaya cf. arnoldii]
MSHPRVEEVSESESDPSIEDPSEYAPSLIRPSQIPSPSSSSRQQQPPEYLQPQFQSQDTTQDTEAHKHYQCLYPLYFDASRTRAQGRRVGKEQAVENPLARTIADAVAALGLQTVFEPGKMHPRDWGNPGRNIISTTTSQHTSSLTPQPPIPRSGTASMACLHLILTNRFLRLLYPEVGISIVYYHCIALL